MSTALIPLAEGVEEMEAVIVADTLRRANWGVTLAGIEPGPVTASRGVMLLPDTAWEDCDPMAADVIVLPGGGPGTKRLHQHPGVREALRARAARGDWIAAICAAPMVLHAAGILEGRSATCYPGCEAGLEGTDWRPDPVVVDGHIVTSRGPGTAMAFALKLIECLDGADNARNVAAGMLADS